MSITVALCTAAPAFAHNRVLERRIAAHYPGALWMPELAERLAARGTDTITGDVALERVASGTLNAQDVWVIQEDQSANATALIQLGAVPKVLLCAESPLFAADFYHALPVLSRAFAHCILFRGALNNAYPRVGMHALWFPSFDVHHRAEPKAWAGRKHLVMLAGNKYWKIRRTFWRAIAAKVRDFVYRSPKRFSTTSAHLQLHDQRLAMLAYFGARKQLDLFGAHWDDLRNLPPHWQKELSPIVRTLAPQTCANKQALIADYKFAVCFENIEFPGYVTEKIIDCLVAGVIPIYRGAPDIADFVPKDCYVDARAFSSHAQLSEYLETLSTEEGQAMFARGQLFLSGEGARMFSYGAFAERVAQLLKPTH